MHKTSAQPELGLDSAAWWHALGLTAGIGLRDRAVAEAVLRRYEPIGFRHVAGEDAGSAPGTFVVTAAEISAVLEAADAGAKRAREEALAARQRENSAEFEAALSSVDATTPVTDGRWAGFTVGEARAWCFNLFEFEPMGAAHPKVQLRFESLARLRAGELPEVFGYPERARQLHDDGVSAREYRRMREALRGRA